VAIAVLFSTVLVVACSSGSQSSDAGPANPATSDAALTASTGAESSKARIWRPKPTTRPWQFQLQGKIDLSIKAPVYEIDGFDTSARTVRQLHNRGRKVICYIDVGSWEQYRPDRNQFPKSVIGNRYEGYPNERWLDIRNYRKFAKPLVNRIRMCARKGFDGLEPDNLAGYQNRTGFPLTAADQLEFNRWIARQAHRFGLSVALKNDPSQARQLVRNFDYAVVEQCFQYSECGQFSAFIRAGKPVFAVEYELPNSRFCSRAKKLGFSAIGKEYDLYSRPWRPCPR